MSDAPRNILWVSDMPSNQPPNNLTDADFDAIDASDYTHVYVAFFHFDPKPADQPLVMVYNGPTPADDPQFDPLWKKYREMKSKGKTIMLSIGGWGSGTWERKGVVGRESEAADRIVDFIKRNGFDGVDLNFEGAENVRFRSDLLESVGVLTREIRKRLTDERRSNSGFISITPMYDNVVTGFTPSGSLPEKQAGQLNAIHRAMMENNGCWWDALSWINVQLYTYSNEEANPLPTPAQMYRRFLNPPQTVGRALTNKDLVAGFPLEGPGKQVTRAQAETFNNEEISLAYEAANEMSEDSGFAGVFVWRYSFTKFPANLNWPGLINEAFSGHPKAPTGLRVIS